MRNIRHTLFLFSLIGFFACTTSTSTTSKQVSANNKTANKLEQHYLALGDSYTIGELVEQPNTYPYILTQQLNKDGFNFAAPTVIAKTGWRTDQLIGKLDGFESNYKYDLVSLLIGVNNQYQNKSIEEFKDQFSQLIEIAISYSKKGKNGVFVFSIPDYSAMPYVRPNDKERVNVEIMEYNNACKEVCAQFKVKFYDITPISQKAKNDNSLIANDKLHPSGNMYRLWVKAYYDQIVSEVVK